MKAALLQMVSAADVQRNLDTVAALLSEAARQQAELAVLPEYFCLTLCVVMWQFSKA